MAEAETKSGHTPTWDQLAGVAQRLLDGERPEDMDRDLMPFMIGGNLVESVEQTKACPACGKQKHDFTFLRVTYAGLLLAQARAAIARAEAQ